MIWFAHSVLYAPLLNSYECNAQLQNRTDMNRKRSTLGQAGRLPCYIVEIGRADSWSISILVIKPEDIKAADIKAFETFLEKLLYALVDGNGHWDKCFPGCENSITWKWPNI